MDTESGVIVEEIAIGSKPLKPHNKRKRSGKQAKLVNKSQPVIQCQIPKAKQVLAKAEEDADENEDEEGHVDPSDLQDAPPTKKQRKLGGRPPNRILDQLVVKCYKVVNPTVNYWRCIGSCGWILSRRSLIRITRHCKDCNKVDHTLRGLASAEALKSSASKRLDNLHATSIADHPEGFSHISTAVNCPVPALNIVEKIAISGRRKERHLEMDRATVILFCIAGLPTYLISRPEFTNLMRVADPYYNLPTRDTLEYKLIPSEQAYVKNKQMEYLKQQDDLTMSYDGGTSRGKEAFWTVHVSTKADEVFLVDGQEATSESHTAEWIKALAVKVSHLACYVSTTNRLLPRS